MKRGPVPLHFFTQSGVIPLREREGRVEVLLLSSRSGRRWVIPKGVVEPGLTAADSALREAWEEGGVRGSAGPTPLGSYEYAKWGGTCRVEVYAMAVAEESDSWPEGDCRSRRWVAPAEAASTVREKDLAGLILKAAGIGKGKG